MTENETSQRIAASILIVDGDIISRHAIADYLRHCGYSVVEAANTDEALLALQEPALSIDVILCDAAAVGTENAFGLASWVRQRRPELEVRMAGSMEGVVQTAAELCESGPHLARPYEPGAVVDYINQLRAKRHRM
ncbi:response regulator [Sphingomonas sp.]|jgi:CheY-like chemotaxis protein|uniref:response regulator n=1 Tax=Sphingomonas sp. TaxID=28214 RepID=UPI002EDB9218